MREAGSRDDFLREVVRFSQNLGFNTVSAMAVVDFGVGRNQDPIHNLKVAAQKRGLVQVLGLPAIDVEYTFGDDIGAWYDRHLAPLASQK